MKNINIKNIFLSVLFFFLPCAYSYPGRAYYWLVKLNDNDNVNSLIHTFLIPSIIWSMAFLCIRLSDDNRSFVRGLKKDWTTVSILSVWFIAATVSYLVNENTGLAMVTYSACYVSSLLLYFAIRNIRLSRIDINLIFTALSIGCLFPLGLGLMEYYREWGIPAANELLFSRYDLVRMAGYCQATFGNTSNTAPFLLLIGLPLFTLVAGKDCGKTLRIWFLFVLVLTVLNLLIVQSRASIITFTVCLALIMYFRRLKKEGIILTAIILLIFLIPMLGSLDKFAENLSAAATVDSHDNSVYERLTAMSEAWRLFTDNWQFGIGPGGTLTTLSFTSAHEFFIEQGAELGILGFICSICLCILVFHRTIRAVVRGARDRLSKDRFTFLIGPFGFALYAVIGNAPLNIGVANTFIGLFIASLALADAEFVTGPALPRTDAAWRTAAEGYRQPVYG